MVDCLEGGIAVLLERLGGCSAPILLALIRNYSRGEPPLGGAGQSLSRGFTAHSPLVAAVLRGASPRCASVV